MLLNVTLKIHCQNTARQNNKSNKNASSNLFAEL